MKKLSLDETWKQCLKMWKWIDKQLANDPNQFVGDLKCRWLKKARFKKYIRLDCFFCQYAYEQGGLLDIDQESLLKITRCSSCPGGLINKHFHCERWKSYDWQHSPRKFYKKLVELNKTRLAKKGESQKQ